LGANITPVSAVGAKLIIKVPETARFGSRTMSDTIAEIFDAGAHSSAELNLVYDAQESCDHEETTAMIAISIIEITAPGFVLPSVMTLIE
jgi:hypothetical protein